MKKLPGSHDPLTILFIVYILVCIVETVFLFTFPRMSDSYISIYGNLQNILFLTGELVSIIYLFIGVIRLFTAKSKTEKKKGVQFVIKSIIGVILFFVLYFFINVIVDLTAGAPISAMSIPSF